MQLIIRYGPAPVDTADTDGSLHSTFTGFFLLRSAEATAICGAAGTAPDDALVLLAAAVWTHLTEQGYGHMLIGKCSGFEYVVTGPPSCGFSLGTTTIEGYPVAPKDYVPLYAVARGRRPENDGPDYVDLGIDYRGTRGPGDETIRPVLFVAPRPARLTQAPPGGGP